MESTKKLTTSLLAVCGFALVFSACGQSAKAPEAVTSAFAEKFVDAKKVEWESEEAGEWEAEFKMNGKEYSANFSDDGEWMETEFEVKVKDLPEAVRATITAEFAAHKIEESELSETPEGKAYEVALEKGEETIEVMIAADGKVLKKEVKKEEDDNDN